LFRVLALKAVSLETTEQLSRFPRLGFFRAERDRRTVRGNALQFIAPTPAPHHKADKADRPISHITQLTLRNSQSQAPWVGNGRVLHDDSGVYDKEVYSRRARNNARQTS
jgi:hypothetical protein